MQTKYKYKDKTYTDISSLAEALGQEGIFIPRSSSEETLGELGVEVTHVEEPIEYFKRHKIATLKMQRDKAEVEPIEYQGHSFDFDSKSYERITAAIYALDIQGATPTINWTLADNGSTPVTANNLRGVIAAAAVRSDALHTAYRALKSQVQAAQTVEEVEAITWDD